MKKYKVELLFADGYKPISTSGETFIVKEDKFSTFDLKEAMELKKHFEEVKYTVKITEIHG